MKNDIQYNLRMPQQLYQLIKEYAKKHETTVSDYIRSCCWAGLAMDFREHIKKGNDLECLEENVNEK